jgi:hypothetical protein
MVSSTSTRFGDRTISTVLRHARVDDSLAGKFYSLLALPDDRLERELVKFIRAEQELPEAARYEATLERIHAWLDLDWEDRLIVARAFERALDTLPQEYRDRTREAERAVIMNALTFKQFRKLAVALPWLRDPNLDEILGVAHDGAETAVA